jgi:hypothetical protein
MLKRINFVSAQMSLFGSICATIVQPHWSATERQNRTRLGSKLESSTISTNRDN